MWFVNCLTNVFCNDFAEPQKQKPQGIGKLFSQIVINTTGTKPDFNLEEKASIDKDTRELRQIIREMADYLPREDPEKGKILKLHYKCCKLNSIPVLVNNNTDGNGDA